MTEKKINNFSKPSQEEMDAVHGGDSAALTDKDIKYVKKAWLEVFPNDKEFKNFAKQVKKNVDDLLRTDTLKPLAMIINKHKLLNIFILVLTNAANLIYSILDKEVGASRVHL